MEITLEKKGNVDALIHVKVTEADYADKVKARLKEVGRTHQVPGFRRGHIDINQLRKRFGREVKSEVINREVYDAVVKYINDNHIDAIGHPIPEEVKAITMDQADYDFTYMIGILPEINVNIDKSVTLPFYRIELTDKMVEEQDESFRERFGKQTTGDTVDARALVKGPIMELNADGTVKETEDAIQVTAGIVGPFLFKDEDQRALFIGKHVDDKIDFNPARAAGGNEAEIASMLGIDKDRAATITSDFRMTVSEIMVLKPAEHDQEFFDNVFGKDKVKTEEEYDKAVRQFIQNTLDDNSRRLFARDARNWLDDTYGKDMELPVDFIKRLIRINNDNIDEANFEAEAKGAIEAFKQQVITERACRVLGVQINEDMTLARAKQIARDQFMQYGMYNLDDETITDAAKRILTTPQYRENIENDVRQALLSQAIAQAVTLKEETVSIDRFRELCK